MMQCFTFFVFGMFCGACFIAGLFAFVQTATRKVMR